MAILLQKWCTFGYTAYGFSAALGACRIAIGSSTVVGRRRQLLPDGDENLEHGHAAVGIIAREEEPDPSGPILMVSSDGLTLVVGCCIFDPLE